MRNSNRAEGEAKTKEVRIQYWLESLRLTASMVKPGQPQPVINGHMMSKDHFTQYITGARLCLKQWSVTLLHNCSLSSKVPEALRKTKNNVL